VNICMHVWICIYICIYILRIYFTHIYIDIDTHVYIVTKKYYYYQTFTHVYIDIDTHVYIVTKIYYYYQTVENSQQEKIDEQRAKNFLKIAQEVTKNSRQPGPEPNKIKSTVGTSSLLPSSVSLLYRYFIFCIHLCRV
jgi:hypothetical protein